MRSYAPTPRAHPGEVLFRSLPSYSCNWRAFAASLGLHVAGAAILVSVSLLVVPEGPDGIVRIVHLAAPPIPPMPHRVAKLEPPPRSLPLRPVEPPLELPRREPEVKRDPEVNKETPPPKPPAPVEAVTRAAPARPAPAEPARPAREVRVGAFGDSAAAERPAGRPDRQVQLGGFGAPIEAGRDSPRLSSSQLPSVGAFDLPPGPGRGDGAGGPRAARGGVAAAGFWSAGADGGGAGGNGRGSGAGPSGGGTVRSSGFGDYRPVAAAAAPAAAAQGEATPVEILAKPKPVYTAEARALGLEGEVLLEVLFTASGEVRVLRTLRGLGHGLDEAAVRAAEQIRFKPARRGGQAVDSSATVHIVFRLA